MDKLSSGLAASDAVQRSAPLPHGAGEIWLAGGCFWGAEEYLSRVRGVIATDVGYANGHAASPTYEEVCTGKTGHAETVRVVYDPGVLPLARLLEIYFMAIDPCAVNRQGHDVGHQYRTGIYWQQEADLPVISAALEALAATLDQPLAVKAEALTAYWPAEEYHQKYLKKNPGGYCHIPQRMFLVAEEANSQ